MKFKVGDKVRIIGNDIGSMNDIGDEGIIVECNNNHHYYRVEVVGKECAGNWHTEGDLKLIEKTYTKEQCEKKIAKWIERLENCVDDQVKLNVWYKSEYGDLKNYIKESDGKFYGYGFSRIGDWYEIDLVNNYVISESDVLATDKEVEEALIKEAEKRGFVMGTKYCYPDRPRIGTRTIDCDLKLSIEGNLVHGNKIIFNNGKWAEIIEEPVYEYQFIFDLEEDGVKVDDIFYTEDEVKHCVNVIKPIKETKRIRK